MIAAGPDGRMFAVRGFETSRDLHQARDSPERVTASPGGQIADGTRN